MADPKEKKLPIEVQQMKMTLDVPVLLMDRKCFPTSTKWDEPIVYLDALGKLQMSEDERVNIPLAGEPGPELIKELGLFAFGASGVNYRVLVIEAEVGEDTLYGALAFPRRLRMLEKAAIRAYRLYPATRVNERDEVHLEPDPETGKWHWWLTAFDDDEIVYKSQAFDTDEDAEKNVEEVATLFREAGKYDNPVFYQHKGEWFWQHLEGNETILERGPFDHKGAADGHWGTIHNLLLGFGGEQGD